MLTNSYNGYSSEPSILISEEALVKAVADMNELKKCCQDFYNKMSTMFDGIKNALETPAGEKIDITGKDVLLEPIQNMNIVIEHIATTLNEITGKGDKINIYYDKLFNDYEALREQIQHKKTK